LAIDPFADQVFLRMSLFHGVANRNLGQAIERLDRIENGRGI
jgi:hypothetical protein